jgi:hypothetical protein
VKCEFDGCTRVPTACYLESWYCPVHFRRSGPSDDEASQPAAPKAPPGWVLVERKNGGLECFPLGAISLVGESKGKAYIASTDPDIAAVSLATPFPELLARIAEAQR